MLETGPRTGTFTYDVYQATLGASGRVLDGWEYEAYVQVGGNDQEDRQTGNVLLSRIRDLTRTPTMAASRSAADSIRSVPGSISTGVHGLHLHLDASNHASVDQRIVEVSMSGPLFELPAGLASVASGFFYKEDEYGYAASPEARVFLRRGGQSFGGRRTRRHTGSRCLGQVQRRGPQSRPVRRSSRARASGSPGARSLEAVLGYRSSDYASAGPFDSWKAEAAVSAGGEHPASQLLPGRGAGAERARARRPAASRGVRLLRLPYSSAAVDPRTAGSAERTVTGCGEASRRSAWRRAFGRAAAHVFGPCRVDHGVTGGNPDLKPEEASTTTIGLIWTSGALHPLLATCIVGGLVSHRHQQQIETLPFSEFLPFCYDARYNPEFSASNQWCSLFDRNAVSGVIEDVHEINTNASDWETTGIDTQLDWRFEVGPGQLGVSWLVAWLDSFTLAVANSTAPSDEYAGTIGGSVGGCCRSGNRICT